MGVDNSFSFAVGPLIAVALIGVLALVCRWVFSTSDRDARAERRRARALARGDYGLLVPVATVRTDDDALLLRDVLAGSGIRGTVADGAEPGERVVLVFRTDEDRARQLVSG